MSLTLGAAAAIGGIAALGSIGGSLKSSNAAKKATKMQIAWERERAQNAHQWEVKDLQAAGLNPILSAGGSGAVTGGISAPIPDTTGISNAGLTLADTMSSALNAAKTNADTGLIGAQTANVNADTENKLTQKSFYEQQAINEALKSGLISAQTAKTQYESMLKEFENEKKEVKFFLDAVQSGTASAKNISETIGQWINYLPRGAKNAIEKVIEQGEKSFNP